MDFEKFTIFILSSQGNLVQIKGSPATVMAKAKAGKLAGCETS